MHKTHNLTLTPLYGLLCTEKSYLLGTRHETQKHQATFLAHRLLSPRLPVELIDQIADELAALAERETKRVWKSMSSDPERRFAKFIATDDSPSKSDRSNRIRSTSVQVTKPDTPNQTEQLSTRYIHLSIAPSRPKIELLVPGSNVPRTGGPAAKFGNSAVEISCRPDSSDEMSQVELKMTGRSGRSGKGQVESLLLLDGVEEAMGLWDWEVMRRCVEGWGLRLVVLAGEEGGGFRPRLRLMQVVSWV